MFQITANIYQTESVYTRGLSGPYITAAAMPLRSCLNGITVTPVIRLMRLPALPPCTAPRAFRGGCAYCVTQLRSAQQILILRFFNRQTTFQQLQLECHSRE